MSDAAEAKKKVTFNAHNLALIRDPNMVKNRIFIGNLPVCTKEELESICHPYGNVLGSLVQKNFGFVQFDAEDVANKAASALTKSIFKGNIITVRNAAVKKQAPPKKAGDSTAPTPAASSAVGGTNTNSDYNDCEIIVVDRRNTKYAEFIEDRLKRLNLRVDVLFPNEDVALGKVLANISQRGCLYAILVTNQHQEHNSITVNILYGQPAEHRNMPLEDAIKLIGEDFQSKTAQTALQNINAMRGNLPQSVPIVPAVVGGLAAISQPERHPDAMQILLNMLAENMPLTVLQYDKIIKHLQVRREQQLKIELGTDAATNKVPDPEIELQKKILTILNKPSVAETRHELLYPTLQAVKEDNGLLQLLCNVKVQRALDSLMDSNLVGTIESIMKF